MVSTVRTRPNHYEALGLTSTATSDEIARAFARESSPFQPRPFGGIAQVISAFETLRDPVKRRAYDESIGIKPEPILDASPTAAVLRGWAGIIGPAPAARPDPVPERKPGSIYGAAPREPAGPSAPEPSPAPLPQAQPRPQPRAAATPPLEQSIEDFVAMHRTTSDRPLDFGPLPIEWRRPGLVIAGLFGAVGLLGAVLGLWSANDIEPQPVERGAMIGLPSAKASPTTSVASPPRVAEAAPERPAPAAAAPVRIARAAPPPRPKLDEEPQVEATPPGQSRVEDIAAALTVAETPPSAAVAASLPLPNKVIARTIERIGYACGEVASTTPIDGGAGVFKVTCTSGQSYQARPVRGRYRFRRLGG